MNMQRYTSFYSACSWLSKKQTQMVMGGWTALRYTMLCARADSISILMVAPLFLSNTRSHNNLLTTPFSKKIACNCLHRKYNKTGQGLDMAEWIALVGVLSPLSLLSSSLTNNCCFSQVAHISLARSLFERRDLNKCGVITLKIDELMQISAVL